MSAFFLANKDCTTLLEVAAHIFEKRNMQKAHRYVLSCGELLLYPKQMVEVDNHVTSQRGTLYSIGTPIYKGLSYIPSLNQLLSDFEQGCIDINQLYGEYVLIFDVDGNVSVLVDATGMYKLFTDEDHHFVSSSFMVAAACTACTINKVAVVEQMLYGFVAAPDTLVNEVICMNTDTMRSRVSWIQWMEHTNQVDSKRSYSRKKSIKRQYDVIREYMRNAQSLVQEYGAECGLSGGNDSRLIYASVNAACEPLRSVHTHCTSKVHTKEISIVKNIVELRNTPLIQVPTTYISDCEGFEIDKVLKENVLYFDARNAENIGALSQTHTQWYRKATANGNGVTFSGIAGEIYRNFYHTEQCSFSIQKWLESRVFAHGIQYIISPDLYQTAVDRIVQKIETATGLSLKKRANVYATKRFFDSYRIPNGLGNVVHANNQMNFYLAPFTESKLIMSARPDYRWHEHCGAYEGKITQRFMPEAAELMGSKGYKVSSVPLMTRIKWYMLSVIPFAWWNRMTRKCCGNATNAKKYRQIVENSPYYQTALSYFQSIFPDWDMTLVNKGTVLLNNFVFSICAVYEISQLQDDGLLCQKRLS